MASKVVNCLLLLVVSICTLDVQAFSLNAPAALSPRILGGLEVMNRCKAPYNSIVALEVTIPSGPSVFCSGNLITDRMVVTTAFCVESLRKMLDTGITVTAVVGERDLQGTDSEEQRILIAGFKSYVAYNEITLENNIGLIQLSIPARLGACVQLSQKYESDPNACTDVDKSCFMVGWGAYTENVGFLGSSRLRAADVIVYGDLVSRILLQGDLPSGNLVFEGANPRNQACHFDWGNMVACKRNNKYVLRGLVGRIGCLTENVPMLMTDITLYDSWLNQCTLNWANC